MSSETRLIRPFQDASNTQRFFENHLTIDLINDGKISEQIVAGSTVRVSAEQLMVRTIALSGISHELEAIIYRDVAKIENSDPSKIELIVVAVSRFLKQTEVIKRIKLSSLSMLGNKIELESKVFQCVHHGWEVLVALVISESFEPKVGFPWRKGTWLAKVHYSVANPVEGIGFTPRVLSDEVRNYLSLHPQTTRYSMLSEGVSILECSNLDDALEFYVDENILTSLSAAPSSAFSILEQTRIFIDALGFIVSEISRAEGFRELTMEDVEGSLCHKILILLAGDGRQSQDAWLSEWQISPSKVLAGLEAHAKLNEKLGKAMAVSN
jgi:hypothetical protein